MFFSKHLSKVKNFLGHGYAKTKDLLGHGYAKGKEFLGRINEGYGHAKQIYNVVSPLLDKYLPGNASHKIKDAVSKGMNKYENLREKVIDNHDHIRDHVQKHATGLIRYQDKM